MNPHAMNHQPPVVRGHYIPGGHAKVIGKKLSSHLKYAEHRKRGENETREDRRIFNQGSDQIDRKDALEDVMEHRSRAVSYHKMIFSPAEYEHVDDFRQWIREQMRDLEMRKGVHLHWYGVVHAHPREQINEPHVHVVLAGAGEDLHTGEQKTVRMDREDYAFLRERGREQSNYEFYHELENVLHELDRNDPFLHEQQEALHQHFSFER